MVWFQKTALNYSRLTEDVKSNFTNNMSVAAIFIDFQTAFDLVWKELLIKKSLQSKFPKIIPVIRWHRKFLEQRWIAVKWKNTLSKQSQLKTGVGQGAVSSPVLFNLYSNDLPNYVNIADDVIWKQQDVYTRLEDKMKNVLGKNN